MKSSRVTIQMQATEKYFLYASLRKHPFLLALRRLGRFARSSGEERGETDVFAGYLYAGVYFTANQIKVRRQYYICVAVHVEQDGFTCLSRSNASKLSTCEIPLLYFLSTDSSSSSPSAATASAAICAKFSLSSVSSPGCCKKKQE